MVVFIIMVVAAFKMVFLLLVVVMFVVNSHRLFMFCSLFKVDMTVVNMNDWSNHNNLLLHVFNHRHRWCFHVRVRMVWINDDSRVNNWGRWLLRVDVNNRFSNLCFI